MAGQTKEEILINLALQFNRSEFKNASQNFGNIKEKIKQIGLNINKIRTEKLNQAMRVGVGRGKISKAKFSENNKLRAIEINKLQNQIRGFADYQQELQGTIKFQTKASSAMQTLRNHQQKIIQTSKNANEKLKEQGLDMRSLFNGTKNFNSVMKLTPQQMEAVSKANMKLGSTGARVAMTFKKIQMAQHKMLMGMLGVMFFGMAMKQMFGSLLAPAAEAYGVFDLFSAVLLVTFIPAMDMIMPYLITIAEFFMNLPEPVKKGIGVMALFGLALGIALTFIGQMTIGLTALIGLITGKGLAASFEILTKAVAGFGTAMKGVFTVSMLGWIAGIGIALFAMFKISEAGLAKQGLQYKDTWSAILGTLVDFVAGAIGLFWLLPSAVVHIAGAIVNVFKGLFAGLKGMWDAYWGGEDMTDAFMSGIKKGLSDAKNSLMSIATDQAFINQKATQFKQEMGLVVPIPVKPINTGTGMDFLNSNFNKNTQMQSNIPSGGITMNVTNNIQAWDAQQQQQLQQSIMDKQMDELRRLARN